MDGDRLTTEELADRSGASRDRIQTLVDLGILAPVGATFGRADVMRVRVVADLDAMGIDPEGLATALATGHLRLGYLESAGRRHPRSEATYGEVAQQIDVPFATLERIYEAFGLLRPGVNELVREEDLQVIRILPVLFGVGVDDAQVLGMARVFGDSARRVARYLPHYFHSAIEERFRRRGLRDNESFEAAIGEVGLRLGRSGEDLLGWLFRRHLETSLTTHQYEHVEAALDEAGVRRREPRTVEAVVFADLTGYTRMTEEAGDEVAAQVASRLAQLVNEIAARHRGTVVKLLGDGAQMHFPDPADAVRASLELVDDVASRDLPPAHVGVEAGPMLYDEGDYFGRTVNLAARIAAQATQGKVYVGKTLVTRVPADGFQFIAAGEFELKGFAQPTMLFEVIRDGEH